MEKLLSNKWDNVFLNEVKQEALVNAREIDPLFKSKAVYLFDNNKMESFKSDVIIVDNGNQKTLSNVMFISKESFVNALNGDCEDRVSVVAKALSFVTSASIQKNATTIPVEDFNTWLEQSGLNDVASQVGLKRSPAKKISL